MQVDKVLRDWEYNKNNKIVEVDKHSQQLKSCSLICEMATDNIVSQNKVRCSGRVSDRLTQGRSRPLRWATPPLNDLASFLPASVCPSVSFAWHSIFSVCSRLLTPACVKWLKNLHRVLVYFQSDYLDQYTFLVMDINSSLR